MSREYVFNYIFQLIRSDAHFFLEDALGIVTRPP